MKKIFLIRIFFLLAIFFNSCNQGKEKYSKIHSIDKHIQEIDSVAIEYNKYAMDQFQYFDLNDSALDKAKYIKSGSSISNILCVAAPNGTISEK